MTDDLRTIVDDLQRRLANAESEITSLKVNKDITQNLVMDHEQRFDTLQTRWWKRLWFYIDGWPGRLDLNADKRQWRPWH